MNFLKKTVGEDNIEKAKAEFFDIKEKVERHHNTNIEDHKIIGEILGEIIKRLDKIDKKLK